MTNSPGPFKGSPEAAALSEETDANIEKWKAAGKGWTDLIYAVYLERRRGRVIHRINIRVGWHTNDDSLLTVTATQDGEPVVAFHGAETGERMWVRLADRLLTERMTWKEDQYATR